MCHIAHQVATPRDLRPRAIVRNHFYFGMDFVMTLFRRFLVSSCLAAALVACGAAFAQAQDLGVPAQTRAISGNFVRAGNPQCLSRWAQPSYERHGGGYYVGGGRAFGGEGRYIQEGTWGQDYAPWYTRVALRWNHGRRYQDGGGQYEPDQRNKPLRLRAP